jgi:hypothetical protein
MTKTETIPKAIGEAILNIAGIELKVFVLDNGQRVIEAESLNRFYSAMEQGAEMTEQDVKELAIAISEL